MGGAVYGFCALNSFIVFIFCLNPWNLNLSTSVVLTQMNLTWLDQSFCFLTWPGTSLTLRFLDFELVQSHQQRQAEDSPLPQCVCNHDVEKQSKGEGAANDHLLVFKKRKRQALPLRCTIPPLMRGDTARPEGSASGQRRFTSRSAQCVQGGGCLFC